MLQQVVDRQQGMGLTPAKTGLQVHHRVLSRTSRHPMQHIQEHLPQGASKVGAAEERLCVLVLLRALVLHSLPQLRREQSFVDTSLLNGRVGCHRLPPA